MAALVDSVLVVTLGALRQVPDAATEAEWSARIDDAGHRWFDQTWRPGEIEPLD